MLTRKLQVRKDVVDVKVSGVGVIRERGITASPEAD
jgi:hypothetical protein